MAQLTKDDKPKDKPKKKEDAFRNAIWQQDPTSEELKEMAELTKCFEDLGQTVDPNSIRRAVVRENMPRYMTLI